nr:hypothetical protein Iba_chr13bCG12990 [Ipomoea batatas]
MQLRNMRNIAFISFNRKSSHLLKPLLSDLSVDEKVYGNADLVHLDGNLPVSESNVQTNEPAIPVVNPELPTSVETALDVYVPDILNSSKPNLSEKELSDSKEKFSEVEEGIVGKENPKSIEETGEQDVEMIEAKIEPSNHVEPISELSLVELETAHPQSTAFKCFSRTVRPPPPLSPYRLPQLCLTQRSQPKSATIPPPISRHSVSHPSPHYLCTQSATASRPPSTRYDVNGRNFSVYTAPSSDEVAISTSETVLLGIKCQNWISISVKLRSQ